MQDEENKDITQMNNCGFNDIGIEDYSDKNSVTTKLSYSSSLFKQLVNHSCLLFIDKSE